MGVNELKLREAFELWAKERLSLNVWTDNYSYTSSHTISAWEAWQAALAQRETKHPSEGAEKCDACGTVTARLDGDQCAKWCCHCGAKLTGNYVYTASPSREALAQQPAAVVELTDDEIESVAHRSCSIYVHGRDQIYHRYEFGRLTIFDFAIKLIQTYRAKQGGAA